jgi:hypothetical protein
MLKPAAGAGSELLKHANMVNKKSLEICHYVKVLSLPSRHLRMGISRELRRIGCLRKQRHWQQFMDLSCFLAFFDAE